jgi:mannose-6-phosphate isomerase-like protein (cupin superfamily)
MKMNEIRVLKPKRDGQVFKMGSAQSIKVLYPEMGAKNITLNYGEHPPGAEFRQHVHEKSEDVIICISGSGVIRSGDVRTSFEAGDIIYVPAGIVHGTINTGSEPLVMFSCQSPPDLGLYSGEKDRDDAR